MTYSRFAIYYLPPAGALADFGAAWLGWDVACGCDAVQPDVTGLDDITMTPRKYGFHGTLKPPFRLAEGTTADDLKAAVAEVTANCPATHCDGLALTALGGFLALTPQGDTDGLRHVAGTYVQQLDRFRAPPNEAELARRRNAGLTPRQEALLADWGYPYVMDEFRFHLTLSGRLDAKAIARWTQVLEPRLPPLPAPFVVDAVALCGERQDGRFEQIQRYALSG